MTIGSINHGEAADMGSKKMLSHMRSNNCPLLTKPAKLTFVLTYISIIHILLTVVI
jgi:hypothetical protein